MGGPSYSYSENGYYKLPKRFYLSRFAQLDTNFFFNAPFSGALYYYSLTSTFNYWSAIRGIWEEFSGEFSVFNLNSNKKHVKFNVPIMFSLDPSPERLSLFTITRRTDSPRGA
jgi:hypothetical protein